MAAAGGLLVALAPGTAQALPAPTGAHAAQLVAPPLVVRTLTATVTYASGRSSLPTTSHALLVRLVRSIPVGAVVTSTRVVGYAPGRTASARALGTARAVEARTHLRALKIGGPIVVAAGVASTLVRSRQAVVTLTYRDRPGQNLAFTQPQDMALGDDDQPLSVASSSGLQVAVRSTTTGVCTVLGTADAPVVHAVSVGDCQLVASQPGSTLYRAATPITRTLAVDPVHLDPPMPASYDVTFSAQGGDVAPETSTWTEGDDPLVLPTPTRTDHVFDGWFTAAEGGILVGDAGDELTPEDDVTLYAHWTIFGHLVTFHANYADGPADTTQRTDEPTALTGNAFEGVNGLVFAGWATEADGGVVYADGATYDFAADQDLYAVWAAEVTVTGTGDRDIVYCGSSDGHCGTDVSYASLVNGTATFLVFPNRDEDGELGGYDVVTSTIDGATCTGSISVEDTESTSFQGEGTVHFRVRGSGTIHLDVA